MHQAKSQATHPDSKTARTSAGRLRRVWRAAHEPVPGVPTWARRAAYAVPLVVLPSSVWRLGVIFGDDKRGGMLPDWAMDGYVVLLSVLSELLAFTAIGLIARWGEVFPRWVPILRGRRVPTAAAAVPAAIGATVLTLMWTAIGVLTEVTQTKLNGDPLPDDFPSRAGGWESAYYYVSYAPLVLWGPLLAAVTIAYLRRRRSAAPGRLAATAG
ncbi:hypothetical protein OG948_46365 (plasmid) [Embleya sp. NBC_00888]|uniref:hypothetical protein n=1 Tax=Embleya sp. NBC_00888 TaxID=2975960 RepID=UPI002F90E4E1|nr:hypothetical protein OG948_46365 [Embleya sp. NBC_00888]